MTNRECEFDLPHASVGRIVKNAVTAKVQLAKDCKTSLSKCGGIFILYLTSVANDFRKENKRQTIVIQDVFSGLEEIGFGDFVPHLKSMVKKRKKGMSDKAREKSAEKDVAENDQNSQPDETEKKKPKLE
eukprot:augustus_masked-scaffold_12-processed-gene-12.90-mRNA-1 protein AED:0.38 eAED:0.38 QI:0/-1/0/1/-1/1/1/0/129